MDTTENVRTGRPRAWWYCRPPALFYVIGALALLRIVVAWVEPGHTLTESTVWTVGASVVALLSIGGATATLVHQRRTGEVERAPLAQESDPRLRG